MKILHISLWDKQGGASIAAYRLHKAMRENGRDSKMLVFNKFLQGDSTIISISSVKKRCLNYIFNILESRRMSKFRPYLGNFSLSYNGFNLKAEQIFKEADIVYLHWINDNFISISEIEQILKTGKTIIWFLHDMWPMTGGCHYSLDCIKYQIECGACPLLKSSNKKDISYQILKEKKGWCSSHNNLVIVTPSKWLGKCAKSSLLFSANKNFIIPNLLNTNIFKPIDKKSARQIMNLPENGKIILFGAEKVTNAYKGWKYLIEALALINKDYLIVTFGEIPDQSDLVDIPLIHFSTGRIFDDYSLVLLYNTADVFVIPSLAENFPQTALESISCGTPVVGFNVGGIPDIVKHKETGFLANYRDAVDLAEGIGWVLSNPEYAKMTDDCRKYAVNNFSSKRVVSKHFELLDLLIGE